MKTTLPARSIANLSNFIPVADAELDGLTAHGAAALEAWALKFARTEPAGLRTYDEVHFDAEIDAIVHADKTHQPQVWFRRAYLRRIHHAFNDLGGLSATDVLERLYDAMAGMRGLDAIGY